LTTHARRATLRLLLLILTTIRRLALLLFVFLVWTPAAYAWSWPVQGPVLQPFAYDESHPYASGQHRGVDIGADAAGESVVAPAAGTVSFAGTVPTNGKTVTIETADGYSVTLTHLGSIAVTKGATVAEQDAVGTIGPSGTPEEDVPYVHLGIRVTTDPNGYVDPLGLLPPAAESGGTQIGSTSSQPSAGSAAAPKSKPASAAPARPRRATTRGATTARPAHERGRGQNAEARPSRPPHQQDVRAGEKADLHQRRHATAPRTRVSAQASLLRRPVVEVAAPGEPAGLDAGQTLRPSANVTPPRREPSSPLPALLCNWAAAVFALGAALVVRRRRVTTNPGEHSRVLHLPRREPGPTQMSRAA
jgi:Peptidase family M23